MTVHKLRDAEVRLARPREKLYKLFDGGSLFLAVTPAGGKHWRLQYRVGGKQSTLSLGSYPTVSLAQARQKAQEARRTLPTGRVARMTLREACEAYWAGREDLSEIYRTNATRALEMHVLPHLGNRLVGTITREDLMGVLDAMNNRGLYVYVRKVRRWVGQVLQWAEARGMVTVNVARLIDPRAAFGSRRTVHYPALALSEVPAFMSRMALEGRLQSVLACELLALTWTRTGELRGARWSEIDGDVWEVPKSRTKRRRDHLVPLSAQAVARLDEIRSWGLPGELVFPSRRFDRPISENAILALIARMDYAGRMSGHGWRSVGSTWANEHGWSPDVIERQLAHESGDEVRAAYNRAEYLPARRRMLQAFADWLLPEPADPRARASTGASPATVET